MASIATLTIDLIGKSGKLTAELNKANKQTSSWADKTRKMVGGSAKVMAGFGVTGAAAFASIYAKNAEFIDQQAKTADRLGITTQALGGLQHAANLYGASNEELNKSLQTMQKNLGQVGQTGTGEAKYALDGLGLSVQELQGLAPEEQFKLIADKLKGVEDQSQKVYLAQSLMGKSGAKMINVMDAGADGITAMMEEADALGMTFDRIDAAKVEMANDAFDKAQKTTHSFGQTLAIETAPIIGAIADMWTDSAKEAGGFGSIAQQVVTKVATGIGFLADMGRGLQVTFLLVRQAMAELVNGVIQIGTVGSKVGGKIGDMLGFDTQTLDEINLFADSVSQTTDSLGKELSDLALEPMPSEKVKTWIADVQTKFEAAAQEQVNNPKKKDLSDLLLKADPKIIDEKSQKLIDAARNQYQQIFDAQLQQDGKEVELENRRFERKQQAMEREFQLLRDKNLITAEIEAEYTTAKEQALAQHEQNISLIKQEQLEARKEAERLHQEQLAEQNNGFWTNYMESIRTTAENTDQLWADTLTNFSQTMSSNITQAITDWQGFGNLVKNIASSFSKAVIQSLVEIGTQRLVLWALEATLGKASGVSYLTQVTGQAQAGAHLAAINAFASTAAIPIIGPALAPGAALAAEAVTQPLAAAATAAAAGTLASFDGGGYTWDGPRSGGLDGKGGQLAMLHPQETVVDHTKGQSLGSNVTVNVIEDASRAGSQSRSGLNGEDVINIFVSNIRQGGEASSALESTYSLQRQGV
ncbi:hypothetical protein [Pseudoalteromonas sp. NZS37]|uniref:hypothetical protein n=1 Tax=Pseudoalteromonas sp. NZS37 TaxID=2792071 RepID=UPI0018CD5AB6|nr:hypothetical protein [Pseudoalteromonas sp. NZS37]MBG9991603.1 hypothetical protein [Pseudoalteromonas sp. NZS37]